MLQHSVFLLDSLVERGRNLTPGNTNDGQMFAPVLDRAMGALEWLRPKYVIADRGYDFNKCYQAAMDRDMVPIIHIRDTKAKNSSPVYDPVAGAPTCLGKTPMEYVRTDPETGHHLFRCPKSGCPLKPKSNGAWQYCDDEVWENPMENLRIVGIVARQSQEWEDHYDKRQSVERLFGSLKRSRNLEEHFSRNIRRMELHAMLSLLTWQATALARATAGEAKNLRLMRVGMTKSMGLAA